ncbi:MAG: cell division protein PerM, partial [Angustibacter sp.]
MTLPVLRRQVRSRLRWGPPESPVRPLLAVGLGAFAAGLSWLALALPLLLAWASSAQTAAAWSQALRVTGYAWLLGHRIGLVVPGGELTAQPLAAMALPLWLWWRVGSRIGAGVEIRRRTPSAVLREVAPLVACSALGYSAVLMLGALLGRQPDL